MQVNLNMLPFKIDEDFKVSQELLQKMDILDTDLHVTGSINYDLSDNIITDLIVTGNIYLKDAVNLEKVKYPINIKIVENLSEFDNSSAIFDEFNKNLLDLSEFLWENIVLEVPISFSTSSGTNLKGEGWELNKAVDEENTDERFAKLNEIFKGGE
jgi:uncharacterized metal-binding protein YceD (DUF177 family)